VCWWRLAWGERPKQSKLFGVDGIKKLRTKPWHPTSAARRELRRTSFFQLAYVQYSLYRCKSTPNAHPMIPKCRRAGSLSGYKLSPRYNAFLISMMLRDIRCPSSEKKNLHTPNTQPSSSLLHITHYAVGISFPDILTPDMSELIVRFVARDPLCAIVSPCVME